MSISPPPRRAPWSACAFVDYLCTVFPPLSLRAFAMYVAFLPSDSYAPSDGLEGLGVFVGLSPCLLSTLLHLPCRLSRVPYGGRQPDEGGGAWSTVPSALCGSPDGAWGQTRCIPALFHWAYGAPGVEHTSVSTVSVGLAGIIGKVCQGHRAPKDFMRFMEIHPVVSQSSTPSWVLAFASLCLAEPCCSRHRAVYALRLNDSRGTCIPQGGHHIPP